MTAVHRSIITALVAVHLAANLWHGGAHTALAVDLPPEKLAFVIAVILIAPVVAAVLVWTRFLTVGVWLLLLSMLGALLFGVYHHYILVSPDNVAHLPNGPVEVQGRFIGSAALLAILELTGSLYAAYVLGTLNGNRA